MEKIATLGKQAAGFGHGINNHLATILMGTQRLTCLMKKEGAGLPDPQKYLNVLGKVEEAANQCKEIVADLQSLDTPGHRSTAFADINEIIREPKEPLAVKSKGK